MKSACWGDAGAGGSVRVCKRGLRSGPGPLLREILEDRRTNLRLRPRNLRGPATDSSTITLISSAVTTVMWTEESLNRAGILLNVISGVLLTPTIVGLDRIRRAERLARVAAWRLRRMSERRLQRHLQVGRNITSFLLGLLRALIKGIFKSLLPGVRLPKWRGSAAFAAGVATAVSVAYVTLLTFLPLAILTYLGLTISASVAVQRSFHIGVGVAAAIATISVAVLLLACGTAVLIVGIRTESPFLMYSASVLLMSGLWPLLLSFMPESIEFNLARGVHRIGSMTQRYLTANNRLVTMMTFVGMTLFILGNAMQFAATYYRR